MKLKRIFIMTIILLSFAKLLYPIPGYYIEPKISFYPHLNKYDVKKAKNYKYALGYGLAAGFDFSMIGALPFRVEFEYLGNHILSDLRRRNDYFLANVYYDIHFFYVRRDELAYRTTLEVYRSMPIFSIYAGLSGGMATRTTITDAPSAKDNIIKTPQEFEVSYLWGINAGFTIHATRYLGVNFGYKWANTAFYKDSHEVLLGLRFTIPNLSSDVTGMFIRE